MKLNSKSTGIIAFTKVEKRGIVLLIIIIVAAPYMFTQWSTGIEFKGMGEIGDVIGGVTAPFVNLLAAYLVYKSFAAQIQANASQRRDHNRELRLILNDQTINHLMSLYINMEKDYNENVENGTRWSDLFRSGFDKIDKAKELKKDPNSDYDPHSQTFQSIHLSKQGIREIEISVEKVIPIYHNFIIITDIMLRSIDEIKRDKTLIHTNKTLIHTVRYIAYKINNLFTSNNYDYILKIEMVDYVTNFSSTSSTMYNLTLLKKSADDIRSKLSDIMDRSAEAFIGKSH